MNKTTLTYIGIAVAVLVIGGGFWYMTGGRPSDDLGVEPNTDITDDSDLNQVNTATPFSLKGSLADIMGKGGSYVCDFNQSLPTGASKGKVYVSGSKVRGDFETHVAQVNIDIKSHMISDGQYAYTWSDMMAQGVKAKVATGAQSGTPGTQSFDSNETLDYSCNPWAPDKSVFTVPSSVTFTEAK